MASQKHVRVKVERERACRKLPDSAHDFRAEQRHILFNVKTDKRFQQLHVRDEYAHDHKDRNAQYDAVFVFDKVD